jgi:hypothetical protein
VLKKKKHSRQRKNQSQMMKKKDLQFYHIKSIKRNQNMIDRNPGIQMAHQLHQNLKRKIKRTKRISIEIVMAVEVHQKNLIKRKKNLQMILQMTKKKLHQIHRKIMVQKFHL